MGLADMVRDDIDYDGDENIDKFGVNLTCRASLWDRFPGNGAIVGIDPMAGTEGGFFGDFDLETIVPVV